MKKSFGWESIITKKVVLLQPLTPKEDDAMTR